MRYSNNTYDTIILGGGSMGLAAAYDLGGRGQKVLVLDKFESPHTFGSHHGSTRLIRIAYAEGEHYVPLAKRARELWLELERASRRNSKDVERLFDSIGVVSVLHPNAPSIQQIETCVQTYKLPFERLDSQTAMKRWPGLTVPNDYVVHFDPEGGVLFSEACLRALKRGCDARGVDFIFGDELKELTATDDAVSVDWGAQRFTASHLIVSVGAGAAGILQAYFPEWRIPLQPIRKVIAWYAPTADRIVSAADPVYSAPHFPGFCVETPDAWFYGFPDFGEGVKVGRHDGGTPCSFETVDRTFVPHTDDSDLRTFLKEFMPGAAGSLEKGAVCMYTMTPDEHFVIDCHPEHAHVILAAGFSGHGFKFASAVGEALSEWVTTGKTTVDLSFFRSSRFADHND